LLILVILVPLALLLSLVVIPMFGEIFEDFDLALPRMTLAVLEAAEHTSALVVAALALLIGLPMVLRLFGGRRVFDRMRTATPLVGKLWTWSGQREFAAMLASFLELRLPLDRAVAHTGEVLSDRNLAWACRRLKDRIAEGQPLSDSLRQSIHFDRSLVTLVAWGERNGLLADALRIAAALFDDRVEQHASVVRRMLPPVTMVVVATCVMLIVVGLMLPLIQLIGGLSG
jgi:general secretion pathway protein F